VLTTDNCCAKVERWPDPDDRPCMTKARELSELICGRFAGYLLKFTETFVIVLILISEWKACANEWGVLKIERIIEDWS